METAEERATTPAIKRLDDIDLPIARALSKATESIPRWIQWAAIAAAFLLAITEFWPLKR